VIYHIHIAVLTFLSAGIAANDTYTDDIRRINSFQMDCMKESERVI